MDQSYFNSIPGSSLPLVVRIWKWCTLAASGWSLVHTIRWAGVTSTPTLERDSLSRVRQVSS